LNYGSAVMPNERPQRKIYLNAFYIDKYPVTNEQFELFELSTGFRTPSIREYGNWRDYYRNEQENYPAVCVPFEIMNLYSLWAGKRLPTEAEWEKASRSYDKRLWPWGNDFSPDKCNSKESQIEHLTPVDKFESYKSPYGCADMVGNCWELVSDWYDVDYTGMHNYYSVSPQKNPKGPKSGVVHVMRGGAYSTLLGNCRCSFKIGYDSSTKWDRIGFRCARDTKK
jgi:sulfatase modifying factor 1